MKAAVVHRKNDIRIEDIPRPVPGPGEVLVKVKGSGVCATDVKILSGSGLPKKLPTILGHEVSGIVAAHGRGVSYPELGKRVAVYPIAACGQCFFCQREHHSLCAEPYGLAHGADGGFAEYVLVPSQIVNLKGLIEIENMPFDLASMIEPVSCCLSAAELCRTKEGDKVLILGCGPLGQLHIIVSKALGAKVIASDPKVERLAMAREVGADVTLNPSEVNLQEEVGRITDVGADVVITAVGITRVIEDSLSLVRNRGVFNIFGGTPKGETIRLDPRWIHYGEVTLTGTFASSLRQFLQARMFVEENAKLISKVISTRCGLDDIFNAVENVKNGTAMKTILMFD